MARTNKTSAAWAGLLICFAAALVVSVSADVNFDDDVSSDTVTPYVAPQPVSSTSPTTPPSPPSPPTTSPPTTSSPPTSPPATSPPPTSASPPSPSTTSPPPASPSPTADSVWTTGGGTCPQNYTKNFYNMFDIYSDTAHVNVSADGDSAQMKLDSQKSAVFGSKSNYYTGRFSAFLKLPCGNSSGTVFAFYTSSNGADNDHDEIDIEILGNETATGYTMQTNIFVNGYGNREMRHELAWFNPCEDYHEYFIQWNSKITMIGVDTTILRVFYNNPAWPYFNKGQGLWVSFWDGSKWATQGGRIKIDYALNGPFVANINGFHKLQGCEVASERDVSSCLGPHCWDTQSALTAAQQQDLNEKNANYCTYNYCDDNVRFASTGYPADCQK